MYCLIPKKKLRFLRKHDVGRLLNKLEIKNPLRKIQVLTDILFKKFNEQ